MVFQWRRFRFDLASFVLATSLSWWWIGFHAALVGGLAYMMSGQVASLVSPGHDGKLFVSALFPLTLLVITWGIRDAKQWAWGVLALVVGVFLIYNTVTFSVVQRRPVIGIMRSIGATKQQIFSFRTL